MKIITDEYAVTVAHEILHCFNVKHHGDEGDYDICTFAYFPQLKQWGLTGRNNKPLLNKDGTPFTATLDLRWEDAPDYQIPEKDVPLVYARKNWRIYGENSTHSGAEDCIMRYDIAHGFTPDKTKTIYLLRSPKYGELTSITLCNSTKGTGVNDENHKPMSRYGNAAPGRGDCIHQFCVSDKYE